MQGLKIKLILGLLADQLKVGPYRGYGNCLGIVVVVLLSLGEGLGVLGRDDPRFEAQLP